MRFNEAKPEVPGLESRIAAATAVQGLLVDSAFLSLCVKTQIHYHGAIYS